MKEKPSAYDVTYAAYIIGGSKFEIKKSKICHVKPNKY